MPSRLSFERIRRRILGEYRSRLFYEQWILLVAPNKGYAALSWADFKPIIPTPDRFWADPFFHVCDGRYYIFAEELIYATNRGRIVCLSLNRELDVQECRIVLERPYHLSYPFLFEEAGQLYMVPETRQNNAVELYRCVRFPDSWVLEKNLIQGIGAVDATLIQRDRHWWMLAGQPSSTGYTCEELHAYYAHSVTSDHWTPHPGNPVVVSSTHSRPAGRIFQDGDCLVRPSQDCSTRYGYAIQFNRIDRLDETGYAEGPAIRFEPPKGSAILGTHTYNEAGGLVVIDALWRRPRYWTPRWRIPRTP